MPQLLCQWNRSWEHNLIRKFLLSNTHLPFCGFAVIFTACCGMLVVFPDVEAGDWTVTGWNLGRPSVSRSLAALSAGFPAILSTTLAIPSVTCSANVSAEVVVHLVRMHLLHCPAVWHGDQSDIFSTVVFYSIDQYNQNQKKDPKKQTFTPVQSNRAFTTCPFTKCDIATLRDYSYATFRTTYW